MIATMKRIGNDMRKATTALLMMFLMVPVAWGDDGPRTGYFRKAITPIELLGEAGAQAVSSVFEPDKKLTWQLNVPKTYDPAKPAAVMVFIGFAEWGGGKREWNSILEDHNIIWIGLINGGDKKPANERMLRALLAQAVLERDYKIDLERYYLFGYSGGANIAAMLATSKPELFKGALFYGDALSWGDNEPPKIDLMRKNRYVFMCGSKDKDHRDMAKIAKAYKEAGLVNTDFVSVANVNRQMPGSTYFERAVKYLDERP
jgi:predicted esterase